MATIGAIRDALATRLTTAISGFRVKDTTPSTVIPPVAVIRYKGPVDGAYATFGGNAYDEFEIAVLVPFPSVERAQDALDGYRSKSGTNSIQAAIEGDSTLGSVVDFALFVGWEDTDEDTAEYNGKEYPAARCRVRAWHV